LTEQEYGKAHNLSGYEGVIQFYTMRQKLELGILRSLPIEQLVIEHSGDEWQRCDEEIANFVQPFFLSESMNLGFKDKPSDRKSTRAR
jgi:hypothetical protein